jgi:hypothetical protein
MRPSSRVRVFASLALAAACSDTPAAPETPQAPPAPPAVAIVSADAPVSTVEDLGGGLFRFTSTATLDAPEGAAWAKVHNIQKMVEVLLVGVASDFQWVDGGGPSKVPSRFTFNALGSPVLEEVFRQDKEEKVLGYRLVTPALGIQSYVATIDLDPIDNDHTRVTYTRDMRFDDPTSAVPAFDALFQTEIANLVALFADEH